MRSKPIIVCESISPGPGERWWGNNWVFWNIGNEKVLKSHIIRL
jgi:hypothetical protein